MQNKVFFHFFYNKICIYQKKAVPLHQKLKKMYNKLNLKIMLMTKQIAKEITFGVTKKGNLKVMRKGQSMDKCAMSFFFPANSYYAIYWDTANKQDMIKAFWEIWNKVYE